jgi:hypothetical protein
VARRELAQVAQLGRAGGRAQHRPAARGSPATPPGRGCRTSAAASRSCGSSPVPRGRRREGVPLPVAQFMRRPCAVHAAPCANRVAPGAGSRRLASARGRGGGKFSKPLSGRSPTCRKFSRPRLGRPPPWDRFEELRLGCPPTLRPVLKTLFRSFIDLRGVPRTSFGSITDLAQVLRTPFRSITDLGEFSGPLSGRSPSGAPRSCGRAHRGLGPPDRAQPSSRAAQPASGASDPLDEGEPGRR